MTVDEVWADALRVQSIPQPFCFRYGRAIRFSAGAVQLLAYDWRIRVIESRPTGAWIDTMTGTQFALFGDILIWFPHGPHGELRGSYLVLPEPAARFLLGDEQVDIIPTPVGMAPATGVDREERGHQLTIE